MPIHQQNGQGAKGVAYGRNQAGESSKRTLIVSEGLFAPLCEIDANKALNAASYPNIIGLQNN